jgi:hypothetical protein
VNRDLFKFGAEFALGAPEITSLLHPQPQSRSIAAEPPEARGHLGRNRYLLGHNPIKRLPRYAQLPRCLANREAERGKDVLAQESAGMGRPSLHIFHCSLGGIVGFLSKWFDTNGRTAMRQLILSTEVDHLFPGIDHRP